MTAKDIKSILFVCTGNSCRSVMAEGLMKKYLKESGRTDIEIASAGIGAMNGFPPTDETVEVMKEEGIDISGSRSKLITRDMVDKADLVLTMEDMHKKEIIRRAPESASKIHLLKEFGSDPKNTKNSDNDIEDPIGMPVGIYRECLSQIKKEIERIVKLI